VNRVAPPGAEGAALSAAAPLQPRSASRELVGGFRARAPFVLLAVAALFTAAPARADRKEIYTVLGFDAGANGYKVPANGSGSTTAFAAGLDLGVYYGLTNTLHLGGRLRATSTPDVQFDSVKLSMADGSESVGSLFADHRSISLGAVGHYRFDTGRAFAPVVELEAGFAAHQYRRVEHVPAGAGFKLDLGNKSQDALYGAGALLLEYRFANRWIAMTGISVRAETGDMQPWSLSVPLRVGVIW
jgi:hypothetical protein